MECTSLLLPDAPPKRQVGTLSLVVIGFFWVSGGVSSQPSRACILRAQFLHLTTAC